MVGGLRGSSVTDFISAQTKPGPGQVESNVDIVTRAINAATSIVNVQGVTGPDVRYAGGATLGPAPQGGVAWGIWGALQVIY